MYVLASQLKNLPIMSLQTGQPIATIDAPVVNPANLEIMALRCGVGRLRRKESVILMRDIRQFASDCVIIDSFDDIEDVDEIVRLRDISEQAFDPIDKSVVNESGHRLGKVEDYTINLKTYMVQKLYVHQSLMKSILYNSLVIDRVQIIDVGPRQFTVRDATVKEPLLSTKVIPSARSVKP